MMMIMMLMMNDFDKAADTITHSAADILIVWMY